MISDLLQYKSWLKNLVEINDDFYDLFFDRAWERRFEYIIDQDAQRGLDGLALRTRWEQEHPGSRLPDLAECRMIEFLIALALRMDDTVYDPDTPDRGPVFFRELLQNMSLAEESKPAVRRVGTQVIVDEPYEQIEKAFDRVLYRKYDHFGNGGLFPLRRPIGDQRQVEVWYQMQAYLSEK